MLHKISDFCDKIDTIKLLSDRLRAAKYASKDTDDEVLNMMIETIQADCYLVAMDKTEYKKD